MTTVNIPVDDFEEIIRIIGSSLAYTQLLSADRSSVAVRTEGGLYILHFDGNQYLLTVQGTTAPAGGYRHALETAGVWSYSSGPVSPSLRPRRQER